MLIHCSDKDEGRRKSRKRATLLTIVIISANNYYLHISTPPFSLAHRKSICIHTEMNWTIVPLQVKNVPCCQVGYSFFLCWCTPESGEPFHLPNKIHQINLAAVGKGSVFKRSRWVPCICTVRRCILGVKTKLTICFEMTETLVIAVIGSDFNWCMVHL